MATRTRAPRSSRWCGRTCGPRRSSRRAAFRNAVTTVSLALGGSTNADHPPHRDGAAARASTLRSTTSTRCRARTPLLANIRPAGKYLMEDFYYAGGLRAMLGELGDLLDTAALTVNGRTLGENIADAKVFNDDVIRSREQPVGRADRRLAVLRGNLAPGRRGHQAHAAADTRLHRHSGPAVVFAQLRRHGRAHRRSRPGRRRGLGLVLQNAGPLGGPGMPEWGMLPIPKKLLEQGVRDMVRISDARMSGTSYGACVLHVAPESVRRRTARARPRRRPDRARRRGPQAGVARRRGRAGEAPGELATARAEIRPRLRRALPAAHHPGQRRL